MRPQARANLAFEKRQAEEQHERREQELRRDLDQTKLARNGLYVLDRLQQRKVYRVLEQQKESAATMAQLAEGLADEETATRVMLKRQGHTAPQPLKAAFKRAHVQFAAVAHAAESQRKFSERALATSIRVVREGHAKSAGELMWAPRARASLY